MLCSTLNQKWIVKAVGKIVGFERAEYQNVVCHLSLEIENLVVTSTKLNFLLRGHLPLLSGHLEYKKEKKERNRSRKLQSYVWMMLQECEAKKMKNFDAHAKHSFCLLRYFTKTPFSTFWIRLG
ncbi:unnamed protein product [Caenorhabditis nigoni]